MDTTANKQLMRRWFEEVWNRGRAEAIDEMLSPEVRIHGLGEGVGGVDEFKAFHARFRGAFPDVQIVVEDVIAEEDRTAVRFTGSATHRGSHLGMEPTGRKVTFTGMTFGRWRDGKLVEGWNNVDIPGIMEQVR